MSFSQYKKYSILNRFIVFLALVFISPMTIFAADAPVPVPLTWQNLKADAALGKQISLEAKHLPSSDLLAQAGKQGGVTLTLSSDSPLAQKLVTARISHMNLYDFMGAIGRTYNASWTKTGKDEFILMPKTADPIAEGIAQLGMPAFYRDRDDVDPSVATKIPGENSIKTRNDLYRKVLLAEGSQALKSEKGVPVNSLPPELAASLKEQYMQVDAVPLLKKYAAYKSLSGNNIIRLKFAYNSEKESLHAFDNITITMELLQKDMLPIPRTNMFWTFSGSEADQRLHQLYPDFPE